MLGVLIGVIDEVEIKTQKQKYFDLKGQKVKIKVEIVEITSQSCDFYNNNII